MRTTHRPTYTKGGGLLLTRRIHGRHDCVQLLATKAVAKLQKSMPSLEVLRTSESWGASWPMAGLQGSHHPVAQRVLPRHAQGLPRASPEPVRDPINPSWIYPKTLLNSIPSADPSLANPEIPCRALSSTDNTSSCPPTPTTV